MLLIFLIKNLFSSVSQKILVERPMDRLNFTVRKNFYNLWNILKQKFAKQYMSPSHPIVLALKAEIKSFCWPQLGNYLKWVPHVLCPIPNNFYCHNPYTPTQSLSRVPLSHFLNVTLTCAYISQPERVMTVNHFYFFHAFSNSVESAPPSTTTIPTTTTKQSHRKHKGKKPQEALILKITLCLSILSDYDEMRDFWMYMKCVGL